mgnify:CR=1 FL=1
MSEVDVLLCVVRYGIGVVCFFFCFVFLMIRRPPRSTLDRSSAASDVYKRQALERQAGIPPPARRLRRLLHRQGRSVARWKVFGSPASGKWP